MEKPDKQLDSCELVDITDKLDRYHFIDTPDNCKVGHILDKPNHSKDIDIKGGLNHSNAADILDMLNHCENVGIQKEPNDCQVGITEGPKEPDYCKNKEIQKQFKEEIQVFPDGDNQWRDVEMQEVEITESPNKPSHCGVLNELKHCKVEITDIRDQLYCFECGIWSLTADDLFCHKLMTHMYYTDVKENESLITDRVFEAIFESKCGTISDRIEFESEELYEVKKEVETDTDEISTAPEDGHEEEFPPLIKWSSKYDSKVYSTCQVKVRDARDYLFCSYCNEWSLTTAALKLHKQTHYKNEKDKNTPKIQFLYDVCNRSFKSSQAVDSHKKTHHAERQRFRCEHCEREFNFKFKLKRHILNECQTNFKNKPKTKTGRKVKTYETIKPSNGGILIKKKKGYRNRRGTFYCDMCDKKFSRNWCLKVHKLLHKKRPFSCEICGKMFKNEKACTTHELKHVGIKPHQCDRCNKSFATKDNLKDHLNSHTGDKPYACNVCESRFKYEANLRAHNRMFHNASKDFKPQIFSCDQCDKTFPFKTYLLKHRYRKHSEERRFACEECPKRFLMKHNLKDHILCIHTDFKSFECEQCSKRFATKYRLASHERYHTGEAYKYPCDVCGKKFISKKYQTAHTLRHQGIRSKQFACETCGRAFEDPNTLKRHQVIHSDIRPYSCDECGKRFKLKQSVHSHKLSHTQIRPFPCKVCGERYKTIGHRNQHMKKHEEIECFYWCDYCGRRFGCKTSVQRHIYGYCAKSGYKGNKNKSKKQLRR